MVNKFIYLDNASTTPLSKNVLKKLIQHIKNIGVIHHQLINMVLNVQYI